MGVGEKESRGGKGKAEPVASLSQTDRQIDRLLAMASSRGPLAALLLLAACAAFFPAAGAAGTPDGSEEWGYVEVRPSKQARLRFLI